MIKPEDDQVTWLASAWLRNVAVIKRTRRSTGRFLSLRDVRNAPQRVGMVIARLGLASLLSTELLGLLPPAPIPVGGCQVVHANHRVGMILAEFGLARLQHLHLELLGLFPSALLPIGHC